MWCLSTVNNVAVCITYAITWWVWLHLQENGSAMSYITNDNFVKIQACTMHACLCYNNDMSNLLPLLQ